ncbi:hypothetical protein LCGC14_1466770 [marine sediment metagenome]|uniref:Tape measure protein N-terminal domain-containing protein n=1 Tax=marine sediment metagenome TaxID=412755 RepID=A0A0F9JDJ8_9ZZZZ
MSFNISYIFEAIDRFSPTIAKINSALTKVQAKISSVNASFKKVGQNLTKIGRSLSLKVTAPLVAFAAYTIKQAADFETLTVRMRPYLGSLAQANDYMTKLAEWTAQKSPFHIKDTASAAVALMNFGVTAKGVIKVLSQLGDISSETGLDLNQLSRLYGLTKSIGVLQFRYIRQVPQLVAPILQVFKQMGKKGTIQEFASKGMITFGIMKRAIEIMTGKGGVAFHAMIRQMDTIHGSLSKLIDNSELASAKVGGFIWKSLHMLKLTQDVVKFLGYFVKHFDKFIKLHPMMKLLVFFGGIAASIGPILIGVGLLISAFIFLGEAVSFSIWPITLIAIGILAATAAVTYLYIKFKAIREVVKGMRTFIKAQIWGFKLILYIVKKIAKVIGFIMKYTGLKFVGHIISMGAKKVFGGKGQELTRKSPDAYGHIESPFIRSFLPSLAKSSASKKTDITIHVSDPGKVIDKVTQKTGDSTNVVHLGRNMRHIDLGWI